MKRGLGALFATDPNKARGICRSGGEAAHKKGTAHEFTPAEARAAGQKGGKKVSEDKDHMSEIGRKGGNQRVANMKQKLAQQQSVSPAKATPTR